MKLIVIASVIFASLFIGCVTVQSVPFGEPEAGSVPVYFTTTPSRPYKEVVYFEASGSVFHTNKRLLSKLQRKAKKANVDALIDVKFNYVFWLPYVTAVGVKYQ